MTTSNPGFDMRHSCAAAAVLIATALLLPVFTRSCVAEDGKPPAIIIAVVDFDYRDTSVEPRDQHLEHEARLKDFMTALKRDLAAQGKTVVSLKCDPALCTTATPPGDLLRAAREAGAGILLVGSIQKMSTLVQWAKTEAIDTATGLIALDRLFTFRGDNDEAWRRAESFISAQLAAP